MGKFITHIQDQLRFVLPHVVHVILRMLLIGVRKVCVRYCECNDTICEKIQKLVEEQKGGTK